MIVEQDDAHTTGQFTVISANVTLTLEITRVSSVKKPMPTVVPAVTFASSSAELADTHVSGMSRDGSELDRLENDSELLEPDEEVEGLESSDDSVSS